MSELATEIHGSSEPIATVEFLGQTFADRKRAFLEVEAFKQMTEQALVDSVEMFVGQEVTMTFRPSSTIGADWKYWVSCYSLNDGERNPITKNVTVRSVHEKTMSADVSQGEKVDNRYERMWTVGLGNIVSIEPIQKPEIPTTETNSVQS